MLIHHFPRRVLKILKISINYRDTTLNILTLLKVGTENLKFKAENFHRTFNSQFYSHSTIYYVVIKVLIKSQSEIDLKIATIEQGKIKEFPKREKKINGR